MQFAGKPVWKGSFRFWIKVTPSSEEAHREWTTRVAAGVDDPLHINLKLHRLQVGGVQANTSKWIK